MKNVVIIGNGISGVTAARHIRKMSDHSITLISAETDYFFSRTALMYIYMGHMTFDQTKPYEDNFWRKNDITLIKDYVNTILPEKRELKLDSGERIAFDDLIIATGSQTIFRGWEGENLTGVQGLVNKADLDAMEANTENVRQAVIVGGGLIGVELAEMLRTRNIEVSLVIREDYYWGNVLPAPEARLVTEHIKEHGVQVLPQSELDNIEGDAQNRVQEVCLKDGRKLPCQWVGISTGVKPNVDMVRSTPVEIDKGVLVNRYLETNYNGIYAIGDCAQQREKIEGRSPVEAVWYTGRMMGETVAQTICGNPTAYKPGQWFNSAKFFDIEYQTYGRVIPEPGSEIKEFYWQHPKKNQAIHLQWQANDNVLAGINAFGIRLRHAVVDDWLRNKTTIEEVMNDLKKADFQREFSRRYYKRIKKEFERENNFFRAG